MRRVIAAVGVHRAAVGALAGELHVKIFAEMPAPLRLVGDLDVFVFVFGYLDASSHLLHTRVSTQPPAPVMPKVVPGVVTTEKT